MGSDWRHLSNLALAGEELSDQQALQILQAPDSELLDILSAAFKVREAAFGKTVQLYVLINMRSGLCPEDCAYCSQARKSTADISRYPLLPDETIIQGAEYAARWGACTYCMVASGRGPANHEVDRICGLVKEIQARFPLRVCTCLGLLTDDQARRLGEAGVNRFNHNLNTSERHYPSVCSTHTYADREATLDRVRDAGMEQCSGGIIGMGESDEDLVWLARRLRQRQVHSIPVNFLHPVDGTPLAGKWDLTPQYCLKALCMFRFLNPTTEIRIAGGRELHLGSLQAMGLYAANSIFLGDYLTTPGQSAEADLKMIRDLGFEVTPQIPESAELALI
jgi:biotin synthase